MWAGAGMNRDRARESMVTLLYGGCTTAALGRLDESGGPLRHVFFFFFFKKKKRGMIVVKNRLMGRTAPPLSAEPVTMPLNLDPGPLDYCRVSAGWTGMRSTTDRSLAHRGSTLWCGVVYGHGHLSSGSSG